MAAIAAVAALLGALGNRPQFFQSYLFAWLFWAGISFGSLVIVMMQFLTGGQWGRALLRPATAAMTILPMVALFFLPILFGLGDIYAWAHGSFGEPGSIHHQQQWLKVPFFIGRSVFYFAVLATIGLLLRRWSIVDVFPGETPLRLRALSSGGLVSYVLCMNFASTDWVMSLTPGWYSTIFVVVFMAGQFLAALAMMTFLVIGFARALPVGEMLPTKVFSDLGNMLLAFVVFWTYVTFSQFLIIWSGNLPKEISWYLERSGGGWPWFAIALMVGQFALPFALLLSRAAKRNRQRLAAICLCILLANALNNFWLVTPSWHPGGFFVHWMDLALFFALGGLWFAAFFHFIKQRELLSLIQGRWPDHG